MKKPVLFIMAVVIVIAVVAVSVLVVDRNRINNKHIEASQQFDVLSQQKNEVEADAKAKAEQIITLQSNLDDVTAAKEALEKDLADNLSQIDALSKSIDDLNAELLLARGEEKAKEIKDAVDAALLDAGAKAEADLAAIKAELEKAKTDLSSAFDHSDVLTKAKDAAESALEAIKNEIQEAAAIWNKIESKVLTGIESEIEAFYAKYPNSLLKFIIPAPQAEAGA